MISKDVIREAIPHAIRSVSLDGMGPKIEGKVRDMYTHGNRRVLITLDRVSAFDRVLGTIPFKAKC